jgi:hypothetical protein
VCLSNDISRNIRPVMPITVDYWGMNGAANAGSGRGISGKYWGFE